MFAILKFLVFFGLMVVFPPLAILWLIAVVWHMLFKKDKKTPQAVYVIEKR